MADDRKPAPSTWRTHPFIRLFSSLRFGVTLLTLVLAYASLMSALPQIRGAVEMTEMQAFRHWIFFGLVLLLCTSITIATLARIRFRFVNAGVLTIHAGVLILCGGAIAYFGTKVEGDVLLRSPKIELVSLAGQQRVLGDFLPEAGRTWTNFMPAFGGNVELKVVASDASDQKPVERAVVEARFGDAEPLRVELAAGAGATTPLTGGLGLRLTTFPPERTFFDVERPALYFHRVGESGFRNAELEGLPLFRERYQQEGPPVRDSAGRAVPSKRTTPEVRFAGIGIPTGWFEHWRLPIAVKHDDLPFDVEVTGYLPYIAGTQRSATDGGSGFNPAINLRLRVPQSGEAAEQALFALDPARSWWDLSSPVEFRWAESPAIRDALLAPLAGADELEIELANPPLKKTIAVRAGQTIALEGTSYELTVQQLFPSWPLMSPGYEQAVSPAALVAVSSADKKYTRTVIERYPQLSQDIDETGMRRKDGPYDPNLTLRYRSSAGGRLLLVADPESLAAGQLALGIFSAEGRVERRTLSAQQFERITLGRFTLEIMVRDLIAQARPIETPVVEPLETRRTNMGRSASAIRLKLSGRGTASGWSESRWVTFSQYPHLDAQPIRVRVPGLDPEWEFIYSRVPHSLGATLTPRSLTTNYFPGRRQASTWRSEFLAQVDGEPAAFPAAVWTNQTCSVGRWTMFQSGANNDGWSYTILGVGNRNGVWPMILGCCMIPLGSLFAFYVKPVLKRRQIQRALADAQARPKASPLPEGMAAKTQLAEVR